MKTNKQILLSLLILLLPFFINNIAFAVTQSQITTAINHIIANAPTDLNVGIIIENPANGKILYEKNPNRLFMPASNMKVLTAYAALNTLGPSFKFQTTIYADPSKISNGILHGNVYLKFSADPSLTATQVRSLIAALTKAGIHRIDGQFIIVDKSFDQIGYGPGWMWDDAPYCDGEPVYGMVVDHNCFNANLYSGPHVNAPTYTKLVSSAVPFIIDSQAITANDAQRCNLIINSDSSNRFVIQGCMNQSKYPRQLNLAITGIHSYVMKLVQQALRNNQITLSGKVEYGNLLGSVKPLLVINSKPLPDILGDMLKPSDNLYANVLFKKVGEKTFGLGSWDNSKKAIKNLLQTHLHINPRSLVIVDGSGTSRYDLLTPNQLLAVLNSVYKNPVFYPIFMSELPHSGFRGTLEYRMNQPGILGKVIAKTGSMTGISSLSGYIKTEHNQTLVFVIMMNNFIGSEHPYRALQDRICDYLWRNWV